MTNAWEYRHTVMSALQNHISKSQTISQKIVMFAAHPVSAHTVRQRLQQCGLAFWQLVLWPPLITQHRERRKLQCIKQQSWIQEWHNVVLSDESQFCVQYCDSHMHVWRLRGDHPSLPCIRYRHRGPEPGVMVWTAIGHTTTVARPLKNLFFYQGI